MCLYYNMYNWFKLWGCVLFGVCTTAPSRVSPPDQKEKGRGEHMYNDALDVMNVESNVTFPSSLNCCDKRHMWQDNQSTEVSMIPV